MSLYSFMNKKGYENKPCLKRLGDFNKTAHLAKKKLANTKFIGGE